MIELAATEVIHWFRVLRDLRYCGVHISEASRRTGVPRTTLLGWEAGSEPRHSDGERVLMLWCEVTGRDRGAAPIIDRADWRR